MSIVIPLDNSPGDLVPGWLTHPVSVGGGSGWWAWRVPLRWSDLYICTLRAQGNSPRGGDRNPKACWGLAFKVTWHQICLLLLVKANHRALPDSRAGETAFATWWQSSQVTVHSRMDAGVRKSVESFCNLPACTKLNSQSSPWEGAQSTVCPV